MSIHNINFNGESKIIFYYHQTPTLSIYLQSSIYSAAAGSAAASPTGSASVLFSTALGFLAFDFAFFAAFGFTVAFLAAFLGDFFVFLGDLAFLAAFGLASFLVFTAAGFFTFFTFVAFAAGFGLGFSATAFDDFFFGTLAFSPSLNEPRKIQTNQL